MKRLLPALAILLLLACNNKEDDEPIDEQPDTKQECAPKCQGRECGDDGCGSSCGLCSAGSQCTEAGVCECVPDCNNRECGTDGCGGSCGQCIDGSVCSEQGACECIPKCSNRECGDDGCKGSCGECESDFQCNLVGVCECVPQCDGKQCGDDSCGSACGLCPPNQICSDTQQCTPKPGSPALQILPADLQFGGHLVGQKAELPMELRSVGDEPLTITSIQMALGSNPNFLLDLSQLPGLQDGGAPTPQQPLVLATDDQVVLGVTYTPDIVNPIGEDGKPIFDTGVLRIESNAGAGSAIVQVTGLGVSTACAKSVILNPQGPSVAPQTILKLFGDKSEGTQGGIAKWQWHVTPPAGATAAFEPSDSFPNPTVQVNAAGTYVFDLEVWDAAGTKSCVPTTHTVEVVPDKAIFVELLWKTPADPNPLDEGSDSGADVDLHLVHQANATPGPDLDGDGLADGWFHAIYDCWQLNPSPNWGSFDPQVADNPILSRTDGDGVGPEIIQLALPQKTTYRVGVHYWNPNGFGQSLASLRIWIYGKKALEIVDVGLLAYDLWEVATIQWPSGNVTPMAGENGGQKIVPEYVNPDVPPP